MEPATPFGVGILGCARIAKKNCRAAKAAGCRVTAVASRSEEKARDFVDEVLGDDDDDESEQRRPRIFAGGDDAYDELLLSSSSNGGGGGGGLMMKCVYIPLPTKLHERFVPAALASRHHVLLEKPVAVSASSCRRMLDDASRNGRLLMDGTMFVHHPRTKHFVSSIPNPNRVSFNFTFDGGEEFFKQNIRLKSDGDFMGCIGDLGWYCVRMGLLVFSADASDLRRGLVTDVQVVRYQLSEDGVPFDADCIVTFSGNRVLSFHCSFIHPVTQTVQISGTGSEYSAIMTDAILPRQGDTISYSLVKQGLVQFDEITEQETKDVHCDNALVQQVCMWRNFSRWARKIEMESAGSDVQNEKWWGGDSDEAKAANDMASYSLYTQIVLDALMESIKLGGTKVPVETA